MSVENISSRYFMLMYISLIKVPAFFSFLLKKILSFLFISFHFQFWSFVLVLKCRDDICCCWIIHFRFNINFLRALSCHFLLLLLWLCCWLRSQLSIQFFIMFTNNKRKKKKAHGCGMYIWFLIGVEARFVSNEKKNCYNAQSVKLVKVKRQLFHKLIWCH